MRRLLFIGLVFLMGCDFGGDSAPIIDKPGWIGDWSGEAFNSLDLDNVNGPQGRLDSLFVSLSYDGAEGFDVRGTWKLERPLFDDYVASVYGLVTFWEFIADKNIESVTFDVVIGDGSAAMGAWKFLCWTNDEAAPDDLTCMRLRTSLDLAFPDATPPVFEVFYLSPVEN